MSKFDRYRSFVAIVEQGTLAGAAEELITSPSNVSKQLAKLEQELKVQLVDRTTYKLSITDAGKNFYHRAKDIILRVENAETEIKQEAGIPKGRLSIAMPQVLLKTRFFSLLEEFVAMYPDINYDLHVSNDKEDLIDDRIDVAFRIGEINASNIETIHLAQLQTVLCAAPSYLKKFPGLSFKKLLSEQHFIVPSYLSSGSINRILNKNKLRKDSVLNNCHKADDSLVVDALAASGLGVTATLDIAVQEEIKNGDLIQIFPSTPLPTVDIHLIYHSRDYLPANISTFTEFITQRFSEIVT